MKKTILSAIILFAAMLASTADAQIKFGLKGGLNVTSMSFSKDVVDADNRTGFFIGPTVKFTLPIVGLGVDVSGLYDQRSVDINNVVYEDNNATVTSKQTLKQHSFNVPINLRYGFGLGSLASLYFFGGPQFGFNLGDKNQSLRDNVGEWKLKTSNFSINLGAGLMLASHLQLSANYNIACGKTGDVTLGSAASSVSESITSSSGKSNAWQIALAYYF